MSSFPGWWMTRPGRTVWFWGKWAEPSASCRVMRLQNELFLFFPVPEGTISEGRTGENLRARRIHGRLWRLQVKKETLNLNFDVREGLRRRNVTRERESFSYFVGLWAASKASRSRITCGSGLLWVTAWKKKKTPTETSYRVCVNLKGFLQGFLKTYNALRRTWRIFTVASWMFYNCSIFHGYKPPSESKGQHA